MRNDWLMRLTLTVGIAFIFLLGFALWNYTWRKKSQPVKHIQLTFKEWQKTLGEQYNRLTIGDSSNLVDSSRQHILFIGDSMADGLKYPFSQYAKFNGHQLTVIAKTSASIISWVGDEKKGRLKATINEVKPTYVVFCLGSNELFTEEMERYRNFLENLRKQIGRLKHAWIGPPNWKQDKGLTALMEEVFGKKQYFPSKKLKLERAGDGIHPTFDGYKIWMDHIAEWMMDRSRFKIVMMKPLKR